MLLKTARLRCRVHRLLLTPAILLAGLATHAVSAHASTFTRGFEDDTWFNAGWQPWVQRASAAGAKVVSLEIDWAHVEPNPPAPGPGSASPSSPAYGFKYIDDVLRRFQGTGVRPLLLITDAPRWAQAPGGTTVEYQEGAFEPNDAALQEFAQALARRYSGHFRDPSNPRRFLPRVMYFQAWAEANLGYKLSPQWTRVNGRLVNTGPVLYRNLLNAFYAGIKAGDPSAKVVFTGMAPYGDPPGGLRTPPVTFLRSVLCLDDTNGAAPCPDPPHFDVLASDPYDVGPPTTHAVSRTDASAPDLGRLTAVVGAAVAAHTVIPDAPKPLWVTEFGYDSNPPNTTRGTPSASEQAAWLEESMYVFAHEGVDTVIWYLLRDQTGSFATSYFSGVYFNGGGPKPSLTAFEFPFVVRPHGGYAEAWGIAPRSGTVHVERLIGRSWRMIFSVRERAGSTFAGSLPLREYGLYRALDGPRISLPWRYRKATPCRGTKRACGSPPVISFS